MPRVAPKTKTELKAHLHELAGDIFTAAVEGGSNYWARFGKAKSEPDHTINTIVVIDAYEDGDGGKRKTISRRDIIKALHVIANGEIQPLDPTVITACHMCRIGIWDGGEMDAYRSDVVLQVAMFDEVIYG